MHPTVESEPCLAGLPRIQPLPLILQPQKEFVMRNRMESLALLSLSLAQPIAGWLSRFTHRGKTIEERSDAAGGMVTPAKGAFAIWGPLFAGNLALAVRSFSRRRFEAPLNRWIAWLSSAAFAGNTAWGVQAQFGGLGWPSFGIISASTIAASAATIAAERGATSPGFGRLAADTIGPLAGWLTVATFANLESTLNETQGRLPERAATRRAKALVGVASAAATGMAIASRGNPGYAAASAWGLGGVMLRNNRESRPEVAATAAIGLCAVAVATLFSRRRRRD